MDKRHSVVDISLPDSWKDLTQQQLKLVFSLLDKGVSEQELLTICTMKWSGLKLLGSSKDKGLFAFVKDSDFFEVSKYDIYAVSDHLRFLKEPPESPVVLERIGRHKAVDPLLQGLKLERYIFLDALWHNYMDSKNDNLILDMVSVLYGFRPKRLKGFVKVAVIWWMSSLYRAFARYFEDLFRPSEKSDGTGSLAGSSKNYAESINTMIRALTKGDVCKEMEVMGIEVWRALTELNAQAKEYSDMQSKIKSVSNGK